MTDVLRSPTRWTTTALACVAAVVMADLLFYRQPVGWTLGLYAILLLAALLAADRGRAILSFPGFILAAGSLGLAGALVYQPGALGVLLALIALATFGLVSRCGWTSRAWTWADRWLELLLLGWRQIFADTYTASRNHGSHPGRSRAAARRLLKWGPVGLLTIVFVWLFAAANPVIADWLGLLREGLAEIIEAIAFPSLGRVFMWVLVAVGFWALLRYRPIMRLLELPDMREAGDAALKVEEFFLGAQTIAAALLVFNILFAVQNLLDVSYLWGGAELPSGMTYAEYAQRGAYPLVATALLAALFMLITFRAGSSASESRTARCLVYLWIAQNVFLTVSAGWRLNLYVEVYSLTKLRVAAAVWMLLVALGLVWICVRIMARRSNAWLVNVNIVTLCIVLYTCAFVNFSGVIAWYNCRHCYEVTGQGANLDFRYIRQLGPEAIPALVWVRSAVDGEKEDEEFKGRANAELEYLQDRLEWRTRDWRGWTWRRQRLLRYSAFGV